MATEQQKKFVVALSRRIAERKMVWEFDTHGNVGRSSIGDFVVEISRVQDMDDESINVCVFNPMGAEVDRITDKDFDVWDLELDRSAFRVMRDMFLSAKRQSAQADETLEALITKM